MYDVAIIGAGITGTSIAFELSKYQLSVCLVEKHNDVSMETSKANSGIIHAGYDPKPGTKMARLNVLGSEIYSTLAPKLNVHYRQIGSLVIGRDENDAKIIKDLYERGLKNGVKELSIIDEKEVQEIEPSLCDDIKFALLAKTAGIISPWEMCLALAQTAVKNGVDLKLNSPVEDINKIDNHFEIKTPKELIEAKYVINCAGVFADDIYKLLLKEKASCSFAIKPVKGEYYLLDKSQGTLVDHVIFQTPNKDGKGVLVSKTVHNNLLVGPNASKEVTSKSDVSTTLDAIEYVKKAALRSLETINYRENIRNFSGLRATLESIDDFLIEESNIYPGFINFAGIKSPGLSCGPAFGIEAKTMLEKDGVKFVEKKDFKLVPLPKFFKDMTQEEIKEKIKEDPRYGRIICRCETVSEGEIVSALHGVIPPTTLDGIKRRTNAGMGRCQGGFCGPKVLEIVRKELNLKPEEIYQDRNGSFIILNETKGGK